MGTRTAIRDIIREFLAAAGDLSVGTVDAGGGTNALIDAQLASDIRSAKQIVGAWVYIVDNDEISRVQTYAKATGTLTLEPAVTTLSVGGEVYELWSAVRPDRVTGMLNKSLIAGTQHAVAALATEAATQYALEDDVVAEGALYFIRREQARRYSGEDRDRIMSEAEEHLNNWRGGCLQKGYNPYIGRRGEGGAASEAERFAGV